MSDRPSDGMELDELRDEFDWMFEFQSRMAERIRGDADVHNLADYVGKLENENAKLPSALGSGGVDIILLQNFQHGRPDQSRDTARTVPSKRDRRQKKFYVPESENAELRELCEDMHEWMGRAMYDGSARKYEYELIVSRMHDLGIEVDG